MLLKKKLQMLFLVREAPLIDSYFIPVFRIGPFTNVTIKVVFKGSSKTNLYILKRRILT